MTKREKQARIQAELDTISQSTKAWVYDTLCLYEGLPVGHVHSFVQGLVRTVPLQVPPPPRVLGYRIKLSNGHYLSWYGAEVDQKTIMYGYPVARKVANTWNSAGRTTKARIVRVVRRGRR